MFKYPWSQPSIDDSDAMAVSAAVRTSWVSGGNEIDEFSRNLGSWLSAENVVLVNNGTSALSATFLALDLKEGDEVIVPAFGFMAATNILIQLRLKPIFADMDKRTWCLTKESIFASLTKRTRAVVVTHNYGNSDDISSIAEFVRETLKLPLIEDAAEALGSSQNGKALGTFGDFGTFSFHATKLITTGEGGAIVCKSREHLEKLKLIISHGLNRINHYQHILPGSNFRLPNYCAALGNSQMQKINGFVEKRRLVDSWYRKILTNSDLSSLLEFQSLQSNEIVPWSFPLRIKNSELNFKYLMELLKKSGIEVRPGFRTPEALPYLQKLVDVKTFPNASRISKEIISMPSYTDLNEVDVIRICKTFIEILENHEIGRAHV